MATSSCPLWLVTGDPHRGARRPGDQQPGRATGARQARRPDPARPHPPIASFPPVAAPIDVSAVPLVAPVRPLVKLTGGRLLSPIYQAFGGVPRQVVKSAYQLAGFDKYVMKPWAMLSNLYDRDFLA